MKSEVERSLAVDQVPTTLVTGATGLIGRWLLAELTRRGEVVAALVRGGSARRDELAAFVDRIGGDSTKLVVVDGDVEREGLGLALPLSSVRVVFHLAAKFDFDLSVDEARRANVDGTRHALEFAAGLPALDRFVFLGGYRMTANPRGADPYASGAYEGSKHEAYALFRELARERSLPWTAVHPSAVIGDSRTGETRQVVGLGRTVERLFEGRLPALAGSHRTFVPVVTVDGLAAFLAAVPSDPDTAGKDLVAFDPESPNLPELVAMAAAHLGVAAPTRTLPIGLVAALPSAWTGIHRESVGFLSEDRYDTRDGDAHAARAGVAHPALEPSLARWCDALVTTRFLARDVADVDRGRFVRGTFVVGDPRAAEVVMLHGIPFDGEAMAPLGRALGRSHARLDLPGLGRSGPGGRIDVAWLADMLDERRAPVVLVGHSLGAGLAVRFAAAHPERVAGLVLVAPAFLGARPSWTLRLHPIVARVLGGLDATAFERRFLSEGGSRAPGEHEDATLGALAALARKGSPGRYARALASAATARTRAATYEDFTATQARGLPTLVVHARREPIVRDPLGAEVVTLDGAGHNPHLTHTREVAAATRRFLARLHSGSMRETTPLARSTT